MTNSNPLRRSVLFMPGDSMRKITKATQLAVDSIIMDLEDAVALNQKEAARRVVSEVLPTLDFGRSERLVRLNAGSVAEGRLMAADLAETIAGRPDGYVVAKVEEAADLVQVSHYVTEGETRYGLPAQSVRLLAMIETARGVMNLREIAQATPRLQALIFGAEDFAASLGAVRTPENWEVFYARSAVVTAAAAYGLEAIDMVFADLTDLERLEREAVIARQMGYAGKSAIHPRQVEILNRIFAPSPEEIEAAQRLVTAFAAQQAAGAGAFDFEGKMVDMPMVRVAERLLERARLAGLLA
ncbi:MAG: CoA ester lyase [Anaerolineae bacterium]|nr:CoA ester lyase [Anaerolineae bacterium]